MSGVILNCSFLLEDWRARRGGDPQHYRLLLHNPDHWREGAGQACIACKRCLVAREPYFENAVPVEGPDGEARFWGFCVPCLGGSSETR